MRRAIMVMMAAVLLTAAGVAAQEPASDPGSDPQRQEIPEAGIAVAFPSDWNVVVQMVREEAILPPELSDAEPVDLWVVVEAAASDDRACAILRYGEHPLGLDDHAAWFESSLAEESDVTSVASVAAPLPLGDAVRIDAIIEDTGALTSYLVESDQSRYRLDCISADRPDDAWLSIAETLESIPMEQLDLPDADDPTLGANVDYVLDFPTVVSVVPADTPDFPLASLMNADCAFAMWIPEEDGSATEWLACTLSDEPLQPADQQGVPPDETLIDNGGECVWRSDYWYESDRSQVIASAYGLTITPDGRVFGWSEYPAEPLDCEGL